MTETSYSVTGMVCAHCAASVTDEIEHIPGVITVTVDVDAGTVVVTSDRTLDVTDVRAAVEDAGYELTS
ncbi:heavy-metal-associated domain-containing protein [Streptomyces camelliae]|uniref:Heavy metal-associated domain-containing protein n=1 Tax=Streptomyces camelliae TaxID=3004093 RepID=A0ABY7PH14_9ACTN|nr:heavy metal-associated domain-containing protein [Streptomyces sp. HUAS 2-6]WBO68884.1 heavy metal-associated domain-containing protein [Streptomyces sp. HUAS 2-6]